MIQSNPKKMLVRRAIERLLEGSRKVEDLHRVMLWLRTRSFGFHSVKEIGDGIAHSDERDQGLLFDRVRDFYFAWDYFQQHALQEVPHPTPDKASISRVVEATIRRCDHTNVRKQLGFGLKTASRAARSAIGKLPADPAAPFELTENEHKALTYFTSHLVISPALTQSEVASDLRSCLQRHGLLADGEEEALDRVVAFLCVYMVTLMHQASLLIVDGVVGSLEAKLSDEKDGEVLMVGGLVPLSPGNSVSRTGFDVFVTECGPEWCDAEIQALPRTGGAWIPPIELGSDGLIHFVS